MTMDARHSVSVAGVIIDDQHRALLIRRRDNQHWEPPGGVLELGSPSLPGSAARSKRRPAYRSCPRR